MESQQPGWLEDGEELLRAFYDETGREIRMRLHALWLMRGGASVASAARAVGVGSTSVRRWLNWYDRGGVPEVRRRQYRGRNPRLTEAQQRALLKRARVSPFMSTQDARRWVDAHLGVSYTHSGMRWLLERLGLKLPGRPLSGGGASSPGSVSGSRQRRTERSALAAGRRPARQTAGASRPTRRRPLRT